MNHEPEIIERLPDVLNDWTGVHVEIFNDTTPELVLVAILEVHISRHKDSDLPLFRNGDRDETQTAF